MKRAQFDFGRKALYMLIAVFVLILMFTYMGMLMNNFYAETVVDSDRISTELIASNLLMSPNCLAYSEKDLPRVYLGIVDIDKFTMQIDRCLPYTDRPYRISIAGKTLNFGLKEGTKTYRIERPVLVRNGTELFPSTLVMEDGYVNVG